MKIVFFGTPEYVVPIVDSIYKKYRNSKTGESAVVGVVTQSPKPIGRNQMLSYSPIDKWAYSHKIPVYYEPDALRAKGVKFDLGIISDYGKIISKEVIDLFEKGILNIHFSLLPKNRGASPVQAAILAGDKEIGVSIFKIDEKLDHGPIVCQFKEEIKPQETWESLKIRLFERTKEVLVDLITPYLQGKINLKKQDEKQASYTSLIKKEDGFIQIKEIASAIKGDAAEAVRIERFVRAMYPWPVAWTSVNGKRLKILKAHLDLGQRLIIDRVQLEGKKPVDWKQFKEGYGEVI
jgi:methionyl-tRNA formyltransferase